jgi:large subunit ribosomal protein L54
VKLRIYIVRFSVQFEQPSNPTYIMLLLTLLTAKSKSKRQAAKKARNIAGSADHTTRKVPIYEQSIDMPVGDGTVEGAMLAETARQELRKAMRGKRRATIKETNFLKTMA